MVGLERTYRWQMLAEIACGAWARSLEVSTSEYIGQEAPWTWTENGLLILAH